MVTEEMSSLKCLRQSERAHRKRLHTVLQVDDILEKAKLWRQLKDHWLPGVGGKETTRQSTEDLRALELLRRIPQ